MALGSVLGALLIVILALGAYCALCFVLLYYVDLPEESPYVFVLEDLVFAVTVPFVLTIAVVTALRRS